MNTGWINFTCIIWYYWEKLLLPNVIYWAISYLSVRVCCLSRCRQAAFFLCNSANKWSIRNKRSHIKNPNNPVERRAGLKGHFWCLVGERSLQGICESTLPGIILGIVRWIHMHTPKPQLLCGLCCCPFHKLLTQCCENSRHCSLSVRLYPCAVQYTSWLTNNLSSLTLTTGPEPKVANVSLVTVQW